MIRETVEVTRTVNQLQTVQDQSVSVAISSLCPTLNGINEENVKKEDLKEAKVI